MDITSFLMPTTGLSRKSVRNKMLYLNDIPYLSAKGGARVWDALTSSPTPELSPGAWIYIPCFYDRENIYEDS